MENDKSVVEQGISNEELEKLEPSADDNHGDEFNKEKIGSPCIPREGNINVWYNRIGSLMKNQGNIIGRIGLPIGSPENNKISLETGHMENEDGTWKRIAMKDGSVIAQFIEPQPTDAEAMA